MLTAKMDVVHITNRNALSSSVNISAHISFFFLLSLGRRDISIAYLDTAAYWNSLFSIFRYPFHICVYIYNCLEMWGNTRTELCARWC